MDERNSSISTKINTTNFRIIKVGLYLSVGALEDSAWSVNPVKRITQELKNKKLKAFDFKSSVYSHLDHMDVPLITFTKGLQELRASK